MPLKWTTSQKFVSVALDQRLPGPTSLSFNDTLVLSGGVRNFLKSREGSLQFLDQLTENQVRVVEKFFKESSLVLLHATTPRELFYDIFCALVQSRAGLFSAMAFQAIFDGRSDCYLENSAAAMKEFRELLSLPEKQNKIETCVAGIIILCCSFSVVDRWVDHMQFLRLILDSSPRSWINCGVSEPLRCFVLDTAALYDRDITTLSSIKATHTSNVWEKHCLDRLEPQRCYVSGLPRSFSTVVSKLRWYPELDQSLQGYPQLEVDLWTWNDVCDVDTAIFTDLWRYAALIHVSTSLNKPPEELKSLTERCLASLQTFQNHFENKPERVLYPVAFPMFVLGCSGALSDHGRVVIRAFVIEHTRGYSLILEVVLIVMKMLDYMWDHPGVGYQQYLTIHGIDSIFLF
jgi:hypothetical protein